MFSLAQFFPYPFELGWHLQIFTRLHSHSRTTDFFGKQCEESPLQLAQEWCDFLFDLDPLLIFSIGVQCPYGDQCCWGHICPNGPKCFHLSKGKCWFKGGVF